MRKAVSEEKRVTELLRLLARHYPDARCTLDYRSPLELLVATVLSAQCTDERVNRVTKSLFKQYRSPQDYLKVPLRELEQNIRSTGFYHNKARAIQGFCRRISEGHHGKVPDTLEELVTLPGVGRKTASVVLGVVYGKAEGVVVDTHVKRLSRRLGLTWQSNPVKIEQDLMKIVPKPHWIRFAHQLIQHGRHVCDARKPKCATCFLNHLCPSANKIATRQDGCGWYVLKKAPY